MHLHKRLDAYISPSHYTYVCTHAFHNDTHMCLLPSAKRHLLLRQHTIYCTRQRPSVPPVNGPQCRPSTTALSAARQRPSVPPANGPQCRPPTALSAARQRSSVPPVNGLSAARQRPSVPPANGPQCRPPSALSAAFSRTTFCTTCNSMCTFRPGHDATCLPPAGHEPTDGHDANAAATELHLPTMHGQNAFVVLPATTSQYKTNPTASKSD